MTDAERARALSLLTQTCPTCHGAGSLQDLVERNPCPDCDAGPGKQYVLDDRARRECLGSTVFFDGEAIVRHDRHDDLWGCECDGSGWFTALVIEEPCPGRVVTVGAPYRDAEELHDEHCCGGSGTVIRPDTDRIIAVLEAAGYKVRYRTVDSHVYETGWAIQPPNRLGWLINPDPNLLIAACQALGVEVTA